MVELIGLILFALFIIWLIYLIVAVYIPAVKKIVGSDGATSSDSENASLM